MKTAGFTRFCSLLLKLLGFGASVSGCIIGAVEYGCPSATYEVKGKVQDENGNPLSGIRVGFGDTPLENSTLTGPDGSFESGPFTAFPTDEMVVSAMDVDLMEGGGYFGSASDTVKLVQTSSGDGHWDSGTFEGGTTIVMKRDDPSAYERYSILKVSGRLYVPSASGQGNDMCKGFKLEIDGGAVLTTNNVGDFMYEARITDAVPQKLTIRASDPSGALQPKVFELEIRKGYDIFDYWCDGVYINTMYSFYMDKSK